MNNPKVLIFDIETSPILGYVWGLYDQNLSVDMIVEDWRVLSWAAKWAGASKMIHRVAMKASEEKGILKIIRDLLDEADIVVTQNGIQFDSKRLNARFIQQGIPLPSSYKHIDTKLLAKRRFGFTSNSLEYLSQKLGTKYKKSKHSKFPGISLWVECLKGNQAAWQEMVHYNKLDVLSLEEVYDKLIPSAPEVDFGLYSGKYLCSCGSVERVRNGYKYLAAGKYQRYLCSKCGRESRDRKAVKGD